MGLLTKFSHRLITLMSPMTSDEFNIWPVLILTVVAVVVILALILTRKKK